MTLNLNLPSDLAKRLRLAAERQGVSDDAYAVQLLERHLPSKQRQAELIALLQSWIDAPDVEEQQQTGDYLIRALDHDRLSDRKLYPDDLKGVTW
jgi:plasmid stability protein